MKSMYVIGGVDWIVHTLSFAFVHCLSVCCGSNALPFSRVLTQGTAIFCLDIFLVSSFFFLSRKQKLVMNNKKKMQLFMFCWSDQAIVLFWNSRFNSLKEARAIRVETWEIFNPFTVTGRIYTSPKRPSRWPRTYIYVPPQFRFYAFVKARPPAWLLLHVSEVSSSSVR